MVHSLIPLCDSITLILLWKIMKPIRKPIVDMIYDLEYNRGMDTITEGKTGDSNAAKLISFEKMYLHSFKLQKVNKYENLVIRHNEWKKIRLGNLPCYQIKSDL